MALRAINGFHLTTIKYIAKEINLFISSAIVFEMILCNLLVDNCNFKHID